MESSSSQQPTERRIAPPVPRGELVFQKTHNIRAFIDAEAPGMRPYAEIMAFLFRSRIFKAINQEVEVFRSHQRHFWDCARVNSKENPTKITSRFHGHEFVVTEGVIRRILEFGDEEGDEVVLNKEKVKGCLIRCGYPATRGVAEGTVYKKFFCPPLKYLAHILIHCLGSRKSGYDQMSQTLQNAFAALVLNMKFNFSKMIFLYMTEALLGKREEFMLYPRFVQLILNEQAPDLPKREGDVLVFDHMDAKTVRQMGSYARAQTRPKDVKLFGHLVNVDYVCPPDNLWRNEGSDSESEEIQVAEAGPSSASKRKEVSDAAEEVIAEELAKHSRKRPKLALKPRQVAVEELSGPSSSAPSQPALASSSQAPESSSSREVSTLSSVVLSLMDELSKLKAKEEQREKEDAARAERDREMAEQMQRMAEREQKMAEHYAKIENLLLAETAKRVSLEHRLKEVETCYDGLSKKMVVDVDGYYRDGDYLDDQDQEALKLSGAGGSTGGTDTGNH